MKNLPEKGKYIASVFPFLYNIQAMNEDDKRYPLPPFTKQTASEKVQKTEDAWNSTDPIKVAKASTIDSEWRSKSQFINGRGEIAQFLTEKWEKERNYKLKMELWCFRENRITVRFEYEYQDTRGHWYRAYGNELWEFNENGMMQKRFAGINEKRIEESDRMLK